MKPDLIIFLTTGIFGFAAILLLMLYRALAHARAVSRGCTCPSDYTQSAACQWCSWAPPAHPHEKVLTVIKRANGRVFLKVGESGRLTRIFQIPPPPVKKPRVTVTPGGGPRIGRVFNDST